MLLSHIVPYGPLDYNLLKLGPVHNGLDHIPKAISDCDLLPDWVRDLNYVHSQALQPPSQSRTGSAHCEVIFCSYCPDWPMHGFSTHFQNAHARITFRKSFAFTSPQNQAFYAHHNPKRPILYFKSLIWKSFAFTKGKKSGFQIRKGSESRSEMAFGMWFPPLWTGPMFILALNTFSIYSSLRYLIHSVMRKVHNSSVESQKGVIADQRCSVENQKGAIAIHFVQQ